MNTVTIVRNSLRRTPLRRIIMFARHTGLQETDVFLASYPRSGNTWMKSLLASCLFGKAMDNFSDTVNPVIPIVGYHRGVSPISKLSARIIKTHEAWRKPYRKAVWIVRDPRDVVLSEYKLQLRSHTFSGSFDKFVRQFVGPDHNAPPNWGTHTSSWMNASEQSDGNIMAVRFEQLKRDPHSELTDVLRFLGINHSADIVAAALKQNSIDQMAKRHAAYDKTLKDQQSEIPAVNKGQAGGWHQNLSIEHVQLIERHFGEIMDQIGYERASS